MRNSTSVTPLRQRAVDTIRNKALEEVKSTLPKCRYGLFGFPATGALSFRDTRKARYDEEGSLIVSPRGVFTQPTRTGQLDSSDLQHISYTHEEYMDPEKVDMIYEKKKREKLRDIQWKAPALTSSDPFNAPYEYVPPYDNSPKSFRDAKGKVKTEKRNIYTTKPQKAVGLTTYGHTFANPPVKYVSDPYDNPKDAKRKEMEEFRSKLIRGGRFLSPSPRSEPFGDNIETFGPPTKSIPPKSNIGRAGSPVYPHERPFRRTSPKKAGPLCLFHEYEYIPEPQKYPVRNWDKTPRKDASWKPTALIESPRPTHSILAMKSNLVREMGTTLPSIN